MESEGFLVLGPGLDEILLNPKMDGLVLVCVERWHLMGGKLLVSKVH